VNDWTDANTLPDGKLGAVKCDEPRMPLVRGGHAAVVKKSPSGVATLVPLLSGPIGARLSKRSARGSLRRSEGVGHGPLVAIALQPQDAEAARKHREATQAYRSRVARSRPGSKLCERQAREVKSEPLSDSSSEDPSEQRRWNAWARRRRIEREAKA